MDLQLKTIDFLKQNGLYHKDIDIDNYINIFTDEMHKGLDNENSSLKMLPTYIELNDDIKLDKKVIAIDAGGTNLRIALIDFKNNSKFIIDQFKIYKMPGMDNEIESDDFFKLIANYLNPVIDKSDTIGFCFSYPVEISPDKDGKVIGLSKEIKVKNIIGKYIGKSLNKFLKKNKKIIVLNDTVAALLAGKAIFPDRFFDSFISVILGTGFNSAYIENNNNIKKIELNDGFQIINIESGGLTKFPIGIIDNAFNITTKNPGTGLLEKMVSGKYVGSLLKTIIDYSINDNLFTEGFVKNFNKSDQISTEDISNFLNNPYDNNFIKYNSKLFNENDLIVLNTIINNIVDRMAKLTAIVITSIALKIKKGYCQYKPICLVIEGSTFYKIKGLKFKTEYYLKENLENKHNIYYEITGLENTSLIGAGIAGLTL